MTGGGAGMTGGGAGMTGGGAGMKSESARTINGSAGIIGRCARMISWSARMSEKGVGITLYRIKSFLPHFLNNEINTFSNEGGIFRQLSISIPLDFNHSTINIGFLILLTRTTFSLSPKA
jgi:hypothetical protein